LTGLTLIQGDDETNGACLQWYRVVRLTLLLIKRVICYLIRTWSIETRWSYFRLFLGL